MGNNPFVQVNLNEVGQYVRKKQHNYPNTIEYATRVSSGEDIFQKFSNIDSKAAKSIKDTHKGLMVKLTEKFLDNDASKKLWADYLEDTTGMILKLVNKMSHPR